MSKAPHWVRSHPHLGFKDGILTIGGAKVSELVLRYVTPLYVADGSRVIENFNAFRAAVKREYPDFLVAFAYKSNPNLAILKLLAERGAGATIVSEAGLNLALMCGVPPSKVVFDGQARVCTSYRRP